MSPCVYLVSHKRLHKSAVDICYHIGQGQQGRARANCWEIKQCGPTPDGDEVDGLGVCPAYPNHGRNCGKVTDTFCGGKVQGTTAPKMLNCVPCQFYKDTQADSQPAQANAVRVISLNTGEEDPFDSFDA